MITRIEFYLFIIVGFVGLVFYIDNYMPYITTEEIREHYKTSAEAIKRFDQEIERRKVFGLENREKICRLQLNQMMIAIKVGVREPIVLDADCTNLLIKK